MQDRADQDLSRSDVFGPWLMEHVERFAAIKLSPTAAGMFETWQEHLVRAGVTRNDVHLASKKLVALNIGKAQHFPTLLELAKGFKHDREMRQGRAPAEPDVREAALRRRWDALPEPERQRRMDAMRLQRPSLAAWKPFIEAECIMAMAGETAGYRA